MTASALPNTRTTTAFALDGICYAYTGGIAALSDISLEIEQGERVAILGANGSGKSTLIKVMNGLLFPQAGTMSAFGEPISEVALRDEDLSNRFRRRVGFIFQNSDAQLFSPTVRDEIAFGPLQMNLPIDEVEQRIEDIAKLLEIGKLLDRAPFQLSGGEKKKVAIASSLAIGPDVLLLDEPTTGLDPRSQHWLVELLAKLHGIGKTLITATHDLTIVPDIADRVIVFSEEHRIVATDSVESALSDTRLLVSVNLIHPHWHRHGRVWHEHPHEPDRPNVHPDGLVQ